MKCLDCDSQVTKRGQVRCWYCRRNAIRREAGAPKRLVRDPLVDKHCPMIKRLRAINAPLFEDVRLKSTLRG